MGNDMLVETDLRASLPLFAFVSPQRKHCHTGGFSLTIHSHRSLSHPGPELTGRDATGGCQGQLLQSLWFYKIVSVEKGKQENYSNGMEPEIVEEHFP